jgi:alanine racemase
LGVVTMDMTIIDVSDVPCELGDVATLIGRDGDELLDVERVAALGGAHPYELLTGLGVPRLPHVYGEVDS